MNPQLLLFFLIMFLIGTDTFLISPLLPTLRDQFSVGVEDSGWMMGAYALGYAVSALFAGPLSDRWNRKTVLVVGMLGFSVATILCGTATGFWSMIVYRALAGICAAFAAPQVWAMIPAMVPSEKIIKSMGIASGGLAVAQTLEVPIGTYLAVTDWSTPFFAIGGFSLLLSMGAYFLIPDFLPDPQSQQVSMLQRYISLLSDGKVKKTFLAYFLFQLGNFGAFTFIGTWLNDQFSMTVSGIGGVLIFLGLGNVIGSFFGSWGVQKVGRPRALVGGIVLSALLYLIISYLPTPVYVKAAFFTLFLIAGTIFPLMMTYLQSLSPSARGTISALASASMYAATTLGAYLAGLLYANFKGYVTVGIFTAVCYAISIVLWKISGVVQVEATGKRMDPVPFVTEKNA